MRQTGAAKIDELLRLGRLARLQYDPSGNLFSVLGIWDAKHLHIVDLKYGAGVAVEVIGNLQLKIYALATLLTFGYPATSVTATIVQPRCPHSDGPVRSVTYDVVDLVDFHADLIDAIKRVDNAASYSGQVSVRWQDDYLAPSDKGCRWCLASPVCPALKTLAQNAAKTVFAKGLPYDPAELAATLDTLPLLEGWIKNVREFAYAEAERGRTEVAANVDRKAGLMEDMTQQRGDRRLAVGAGDAEEPGGGLGAQQQLDVADERDAGILGARRDRVRLGKGRRNAGRQHQRLERAEVGVGEAGDRNARAEGRVATGGVVVPGHDLRPGGEQRTRCGHARGTEPQDRVAFVVREGKLDHDHLNFNVARPTSASTAEMIQKRMTMVGSAQPFFS